MYVRKRDLPEIFPPNYHGNLSSDARDNSIESNSCHNDPIHTYRVKKNTFCHKKPEPPKNVLFDNFASDELLLLGLLVFLYVGCEHSKENLLLMGAIAYILFACH